MGYCFVFLGFARESLTEDSVKAAVPSKTGSSMVTPGTARKIKLNLLRAGYRMAFL